MWNFSLRFTYPYADNAELSGRYSSKVSVVFMVKHFLHFYTFPAGVSSPALTHQAGVLQAECCRDRAVLSSSRPRRADFIAET